jgi:hypothetical protein
MPVGPIVVFGGEVTVIVVDGEVEVEVMGEIGKESVIVTAR